MIGLNGRCVICGWKGKMSRHHKLKKYIWPELENSKKNIVLVCRTPCHDALEEIIRRKENEILRNHPEIYEEALREFKEGKHNPDKIIQEIKQRKQAKYA